MLLHRRRGLLVITRPPNVQAWTITQPPNAQAWGGPPEVAPAAGEHARLHGLRRRHEADDVLQDAVRQSVNAASAAESWRRRSLAAFPRMHSVEQVAGVEYAGTRID